ncbi:MAG: Gfo/Idh/MocA family protein [Haloarculaceae archaeon]
MKMKTVGFAVVGVRNFANEYIENVRSLGDEGVELTGVVVEDQVRNAGRVRELRRDGIEVFDSYEELLGNGQEYVDVVGLPVSIPSHAEMSVEAMKRGYDVLLEKPPAPTVGELDAIRRTADETNAFCSVGFQFMHSRSIRRLKELILDGRIGEVESIATKGYWPRTDSYYDRNGWAGTLIHEGDIVLDGPVHNAFAHFLQNMLFLVGDEMNESAPVATVGAERYQANREIQTADIASLRATTTGGTDLRFYVTHVPEEKQQPYMEVVGTEGRAEWHFDETTTVLTADGDRLKFDGGGVDPWIEVIRTAANYERGDLATLYCTPENTRSFVTTVNASFESTRRIRPVPDEHVERIETDDGDVRRVVPGLDDAMDEAFDRRVPLSDTDLPWAQPTDPVDVRGYDTFSPIPVE